MWPIFAIVGTLSYCDYFCLSSFLFLRSLAIFTVLVCAYFVLQTFLFLLLLCNYNFISAHNRSPLSNI